jgi:hypothetical protein
MGFRFRRSVRLFPSVRINLGKRSASVSVGVRGAHVTLRPGHKARTTVGVPGTGLSYIEGGLRAQPHQAALMGAGAAQIPTDDEQLPKGRAWRGWLWIAVAIVILALAMRASIA